MTIALALVAVAFTATYATGSTAPTVIKSQNVLRFFSNHQWLTAPNTERCANIPWTRSCLIARERVRFHTRNLAGFEHARVARKLDRGLAGTPMAGTGTELEAAGRANGIHPAFIAAIAATESSYGAAMCGNFNAYGLGNCTGIWNVPAFQSWGESYRFMGKFLAGRWPHADTPWEFYGYAACDSCWGNRVALFMGRLGFGHSVRYG